MGVIQAHNFEGRTAPIGATQNGNSRPFFIDRKKKIVRPRAALDLNQVGPDGIEHPGRQKLLAKVGNIPVGIISW